MNFLRTSAFILALGTSGISFADDRDVTEDFKNYVSSYFVGSESRADYEWDNTYCLASNPITGSCVQKGGSKIYGKAKGTVGEIESTFGNGWVMQSQINPWTKESVVGHWVDFKLYFPYSGYSEGKKQCFPGDFYCGMEWDSLHPTGRIIAWFKSAGEKVEIEMGYEVQQGNGDKPNKILKIAMQNLKEKLRGVTTDFIRLNGSAATVIDIKDKD